MDKIDRPGKKFFVVAIEADDREHGEYTVLVGPFTSTEVAARQLDMMWDAMQGKPHFFRSAKRNQDGAIEVPDPDCSYHICVKPLVGKPPKDARVDEPSEMFHLMVACLLDDDKEDAAEALLERKERAYYAPSVGEKRAAVFYYIPNER